jgi:hypothetical protein
MKTNQSLWRITVPDKNPADLSAIKNAEEKGLLFSEDRKTLLKCTNRDITQVVIPEGVTVIGENAFTFSHKLIRVVLPESVKIIDEMAFYQ